MDGSNFHAPSLMSRLNLPLLPGTIFHKRDSSSFPCPCFNRSSVLHRLLSLSKDRQNLVLAHSFSRGDGIGFLPNQIHCHWKNAVHTPFRKASRSHSHTPRVAKSDGPGGITVSGEITTLDEQALERDLQIAIQEENYARAAKLRDTLRVLHEDGKASVLSANARFYNCFRKGDLASMQSLWSKGENVSVVHPGVSGISGYDLVMGSWEFVCADYEFPLEIDVKDVKVHVRGDVGYVTCTEMIRTKGRSWGRQFATNVFERIDGQWFVCIHHASHVDF